MTQQQQTFQTARAEVVSTLTGFGGLRETVPPFLVIAVSGALLVSGTSSAEQTRFWEPYVYESQATASGLAWEEPTLDTETTRQAISELRRISGLTWEQLGELFEVSRRSVHFWASGKPLNAGNEQRLMQVLDVVRAADRGDSRSTRAALFEFHKGKTAFALLSSECFEAARAALGVGAKQSRPALAELSAAAEASRKPLAPEFLVDAKHDQVHRDRGRSRAARTVRNSKREAD